MDLCRKVRLACAGGMREREAARQSEVSRESVEYPGRALWRRRSECLGRGRGETKMQSVKLPGRRRRARDFGRQVAALQARVAVLNGGTALGIPVTDTAGYVGPGYGGARPSADVRARVVNRGKYPDQDTGRVHSSYASSRIFFARTRLLSARQWIEYCSSDTAG